jgi:hypothetical protein
LHVNTYYYIDINDTFINFLFFVYNCLIFAFFVALFERSVLSAASLTQASPRKARLNLGWKNIALYELCVRIVNDPALQPAKSAGFRLG